MKRGAYGSADMPYAPLLQSTAKKESPQERGLSFFAQDKLTERRRGNTAGCGRRRARRFSGARMRSPAAR